ncbi:AMP-binding protein [Paracidobacterium acidisoli]|uniref:AMP-binding protein n=1 Tax=Paracidobacterium acidisoli TaxID=2303751 RepID=A0A372IJ75_9BACT|nr:AMP-binding protein [Paracidobacterium acidisoli]MBT9333205.1 AMP-binding protein [Paracidobacterium acidisoli]
MRPHLATLIDDFRHNGGQAAIVSHRGNRRIVTTWAELAALADSFAAELMRRGIGIGERVVLWGPNGAEWMGAFFGCLQRGVLAVPLDAAGSLDFAQRVIADTEPRLIAGDGMLLAALGGTTPLLDFDAVAVLPRYAGPDLREPALSLDTPLQILFTSGTTAEPKGVVHTHRNVLASLAPIEREMQKYRKYERIVHPLRFLHTLPLSHVFGQFMGLWIPPLLAAEVHFESRLQAQRLLELLRRERISVLAAVPRVPDLLRSALLAEHPELEAQLKAAHGEKIWKRWWRFRSIHRRFGYKFWAFVCGGASLPPELEDCWTTLGFALIQGYGMTETAALITLNHPFKPGKGTIGKVLPGREVQITDEGEVLVRGEMVSTATWQQGAMRRNESPWLATGDLASRDEEGQLRFLGRRNQVIVTSSGMNIHPEDVEAALSAQPGVQASAVVPLLTANGTEAAAVLLFRGPEEAAQQAVIAANAKLAEYQRIRHWRLWPELDLPRTSTGKIQRRRVTEWMNAQRRDGSGSDASDPLMRLIASITGTQAASSGDDARLAEDLGLDSLGRVQLQAELEQRLNLTLSDSMLEQAATLGDLRRLLGMGAPAPEAAPERQTAVVQTAANQAGAMSAEQPAVPQQTVRKDIYPRWPWSWPVRILRVAFIEAVLRPLVWLLAAPGIERDATLSVKGPVLLIANHVSTYDVPLILYALPGRMRRRVAAAMAANMLADWRQRKNLGPRVLNVLGPPVWLLVTALFNVFPLPRSAGFRRSFEHAGEALDHGYHVLVFPEGHRTAGGLQAFRPGIGILVGESKTAVVPVALCGLGEIKQGQRRWFRSGSLTVRVGEALQFAPGLSPEAITTQLQQKLQQMLSQSGKV